jgi:hypothetical protein
MPDQSTLPLLPIPVEGPLLVGNSGPMFDGSGCGLVFGIGRGMLLSPL